MQAAIGHALAGAIGSSILSRRAAAQPRAGNVVTLRDDVHLISLGARNVVAQSGATGVVLVDGVAADSTAALLDAVATLPGGGTVQTLFNTCWHPEHVGSNETIARAKAAIIAHENTRLWLTTDVTWPWNGRTFPRLPVAARPNQTFYDHGKLADTDRHVEYGHVRASPHTDGDMYVLFRDVNVLAVGAAVAGRGWPTIDWWTGGWIGGVVAALESFLTMTDEDTLIVPAQGPVLRRGDLVAQFEMFDTIYERLVDLFYNAKGPEEAVSARPTNEFDAVMGPPEEFVRQAFRSLWGFLSPDA